jgi:uncharacterized membrane protein (GlpM family)
LGDFSGGMMDQATGDMSPLAGGPPNWRAVFSIFLYVVLTLDGAQAIVATVVFGMGVVAHWFKRMNQRWYGMVEVMLGAAAAVNISVRLMPGQTLLSQWEGLIGCAYVVARGLSNCSDAKLATGKT